MMRRVGKDGSRTISKNEEAIRREQAGCRGGSSVTSSKVEILMQRKHVFEQLFRKKSLFARNILDHT